VYNDNDDMKICSWWRHHYRSD